MVAKLRTEEQGARENFLIPGLPADENDFPAAFGPFVRNCWYVIAKSKDVGRELKGIRALGEPLVYFRTEDGEPVVLDDRCAHRRFPLSKSKLVGDRIQCGYHGFTYEKSGRCVWAPTNVAPNFGVRRYSSVEAGPWLWVWMGDPQQADPAKVPYPSLDPHEEWRRTEGYKLNPGNYMLLIENLLDLSHFPFLHGQELADLEQANSGLEALTGITNGVGYRKETPSVRGNVFAGVMGGDPAKLIRLVTTAKQFGPSVNLGSEERFALDGDDDPLLPMRFFVIHAITPETMHSTHQFFQGNFNRDVVTGIENFRDHGENVVFHEDAEAIGYVQATVASDNRTGTVEFGLANDRFGIRMRKILRDLKAAELGASG